MSGQQSNTIARGKEVIILSRFSSVDRCRHDWKGSCVWQMGGKGVEQRYGSIYEESDTEGVTGGQIYDGR